MTTIVARRYDTAQSVRVSWDGDRIARVAPAADSAGKQKLPWLAPGLVDLQVNGYGGCEFGAVGLTSESAANVLGRMFAFGLTTVIPTFTTESFDVLAAAMRVTVTALDADANLARLVPCFHLEGPYISADDGPRGAHAVKHCRPPDWDEFCRLQEAAGGRIRLVTLAAEYAESPEFIRRATAAGCVIALGHTAPKTEQLGAAVDAGAKLSTHLGNGAHLQLPRHPNYIWDQMAEDRLWASLIVDGFHVPPAVVKTIVRAKTPQRIVLISDFAGSAGLPPGRYEASGGPIELLENGKLVVAGNPGLLAGAAKPLGDAIANVMWMADVPLRTAIDTASRQPAELMGLPSCSFRPGDPADLCLFELDGESTGRPTFRPTATVLAGQCVWGELPTTD